MGIRRLISCVAGAGLIAAGVVSVSAPAHASTLFVWSGNGDGMSWSDPDNWTPTGVPDVTNESARIAEGQVFISESYDVNAITLEGTGALIKDGPGQLTATTFVMRGGRLDVPVTAASVSFTGPDDKEISANGSLNATLVRGGNQGEVTVQEGRVVLNTDGTTSSGGKSIRAKTALTVSARIDGRGASAATIEIEDSTCNSTSASFVCGVIVQSGTDPYGPAIEGVTLVSSNIVFSGSTTLALRGGNWKPRSGTRIWAANNELGVIETGSPYPPSELDSPDEEVALPQKMTLDRVKWKHMAGTIAGNGEISPELGSNPLPLGGTFTWAGGRIRGSLTTKLSPGGARIPFRFEGQPASPLVVENPTSGRSTLTVGSGGVITTGTEIVLEGSSVFSLPASLASFTQEAGSTITASGGSTVAKVEAAGTWVVENSATSAAPAVIDAVPFRATQMVNVRSGATLLLDGSSSSSLMRGLTTTITSASEFGRIQVGAGSNLSLGGTLVAQATSNASLVAGDEMMVVESLAATGSPSGISGDFAYVSSRDLPTGLGFSGELIDEGYVLAVGPAEPLELTAAPVTPTARKKQQWRVNLTVTNKATVAVIPQLNIRIPKGVSVAVPNYLSCRVTADTAVCPLASLPAGGATAIPVSYTFPKPGSQKLRITVTSAGYNPTPSKATWAAKVQVTR